MRKLIAPLAVAALLGPAVAPAVAATRNVTVGDNWFVRPSGVPTVKVNKGDKVRWNFEGRSPHNVKKTKGPGPAFGSPTKESGSYTKTLRKRGTYTLVCTVHGPRDQRMKLVVD